ncbi:MAG: hypothetical protein ABSF63_11435 [Candidatus Bathyarchaeia archaeon]|jgi:hypothetical protein
MHMRLWAAEGVLGSTVALVLTYYILAPGNFASRYAAVIGWSTITVFLILMIQGFWSRKRQSSIRGESKSGRNVSYQVALFKWGGMHSALSIVVTVFLIIHGFLFLPGLFEPSLALWVGAVAFAILLVLNLSGLLTESARKSRSFGLFKKIHVWLMLFVLILVVIHVEGAAPYLTFRLILPGMIVGLAAFLSLDIIILLTAQIGRDRRRGLVASRA